MGAKRIEDLEARLRLGEIAGERLDSALAEIMRRSSRGSTLDLASARRTLEEIPSIAMKARGFEG